MNKGCILFFNEIDKNSLALVGGKGANLGEMTKAGFPVPFGFCVTTDAYKQFIEFNNLENFMNEVINGVDYENIQDVALIGEKIRGKINDSIIPEYMEQEIIKAFTKIGEDKYYAVRSSATAEDLTFASFAGQQDTYLNVHGCNQLLTAIKNCFASLFTDRAIVYRVENKIAHEKVRMSVVVQKMVLPQVSGVMFTADPLIGNRNVISIDASFGLGEALVSGFVSPDIYKFNKKSGNIDKKIISEKKIAIMPLKNGGTEMVQITKEKAKSEVMSDEQIKLLADIGVKIEKHYEVPQDIEWCMEDGKIYIVQSRAITSLFPLPEPLPKDNKLHTYVSFNHFQVMTNAISPMGIALIRLIFPFDRGTKCDSGYNYFKTAGGRIYIDINDLIQFRKLRNKIPMFLKNIDALTGESLIDLFNRPDFEERISKNKSIIKSLLFGVAPIPINSLKYVLFKNPEGNIEKSNKLLENLIKETKNNIEKASEGIEKLNAIYFSANTHEIIPILVPRIIAGAISFKLLKFLEEKWLGISKYTDTLVKGLEGNITTEMGLKIGDLADLARENLDIIKEFENSDYKTLIERIRSLKGHYEFKAEFMSFMDKYDMRAASEIDVASERWVENPEPIAKAIISNIKTSIKGSHRKEYKGMIDNAEKSALDLINEIRTTKNGKIRAKIIKRLIRVCRNLMPIREHGKYLLMKYLYEYKKAILNEAEILVKKEQLEDINDVFYVSFWELYSGVEKGDSLIKVVEERKEKYEHFNKLSTPRVLTSDGEEIKVNYNIENVPEGALIGMPVSSGVIEGIAKVIINPTNSTINKGEILVAPFTDPGWTPFFINASGLVMEIGGLLTHGTVVAREYGIPAVVGVTDATKKNKIGAKD